MSRWHQKFLHSLIVTMIGSAFGCAKGTHVFSMHKMGTVPSSSMHLTTIVPVAAKPGDEVTITGSGLSRQSVVRIGGQAVDFTSYSGTSAKFIMPQMPRSGAFGVTIGRRNEGTGTVAAAAKFMLADATDADYPIYMATASEICSPISFRDAQGDIRIGTKDCAAGTVADCTTGGQTGCKTTSTILGAEAAMLTASNIKSGVTIAGISGSVVASPANCSADGASACVVDGTTYTAAALANVSAGNIKSGIVIGGITGSFAGSFSNCSSNGQQGCIAAESYFAGTACPADGSNCFLPMYSIPGLQYKKAVDYSTIDATKMLTTSTVSGVVGTIANQGSWALTAAFPGAGYYTGVSSSPTGSTILSGTTITGVAGNVALPTAANVYTGITFGAASGSTGTLTLPTAANVRSAVGSYGVGGNGVTASLADCGIPDGVFGCVTAGFFKSVDARYAIPANIKSGVTLAGQMGAYPSAAYTLPGALPTTADLENTNFNAQVKAVTAFEYWNSAGTRQTGAGDADITEAKIATGVSVFDTTGTYGTAPNAWDVRVGTTINGVLGMLKVNCRNRVRSAVYNHDTVGTITDGVDTLGSAIDIWDTIDDYNNNVSGLPTSVVAGWTNNDCGGIEASTDDANVWKDVTTAGTGAATCAGSPEKCTMKDKITGLEWSKIQSTPQTWSVAINTCDALSFNGQTDWRLPTQKELMEAYAHGVRSAASDNWMTEAHINGYFWSGSSVSDTTNNAWYVSLAKGLTSYYSKTYPGQVVCVR